jgi:hypothetical protein
MSLQLLTEPEIIARLKISRRHIISLRQKRLIPYIRLGGPISGSVRYDLAAVEEAIKNSRSTPSTARSPKPSAETKPPGHLLRRRRAIEAIPMRTVARPSISATRKRLWLAHAEWLKRQGYIRAWARHMIATLIELRRAELRRMHQ